MDNANVLLVEERGLALLIIEIDPETLIPRCPNCSELIEDGGDY